MEARAGAVTIPDARLFPAQEREESCYRPIQLYRRHDRRRRQDQGTEPRLQPQFVRATRNIRHAHRGGGVDPADNKIIGDKIPIGRERVTLGPLGHADVTLDWDTGTLRIPDDTIRYYRFFVTADPDNQVKNEIHEGTAANGNNYGFWPWDGGVSIAGKRVARGVPSEAASLRPVKLDLFNHETRQVVGQASVGQRYGLRATFESTGLWRGWTPVFFLLDDGTGEKKVIGTRTLRGAGPGPAYVWLDWKPVKAGRYALSAVRAQDIIAEKRAGDATAQPVLNVEAR